MYRTSGALALILSICSCDPGSSEAYELNNISDSTLYLTFINGYSREETMVVSKPHTFITFYQSGHIGCNREYPRDLGIESFRIFRHGWQEINLDYRNIEHWLFRQDKGECGTGYHTLELGNNDL